MTGLLEKNKKKSSLFGFTLIEMMIVVAIMTIITGTVIGFNRNSDKKLALYREARKVAYSLRQAQTLAMQSKTIIVSGTPKSTCAWGVKIVNSTAYELDAFICGTATGVKQETINLSANTFFDYIASPPIIFNSPLGSVPGESSFTIKNTKVPGDIISNTIKVNAVGDVSIQ